MNKVFISCENNFPRTVLRSKAKGHKRLVISDDVQSFASFEMKTEGTDLMISPVTTDAEPDAFTFLCKEFGLDGDITFTSDISVIFLDGGYMLVTLYKGAIALNIEDEEGNAKLFAPSIGFDESEKLPKFSPSDILWCNAEKLMSFSSFLKDFKPSFIFDFEFAFQIGGSNAGSERFRLKPKSDEDIDISLGKYALYVDKKSKQEDAKAVSKLVKMFNTHGTGNSDLSFDDDSEDDEDIEGLEFE